MLRPEYTVFRIVNDSLSDKIENICSVVITYYNAYIGIL